jgi:hypothetical protein
MIKKALATFAILLTVSAQAQSRICANKVTGNILIRPTCFSSENTITNIANLKGPKGDTGLQGLRGLTGAQGTQGLKGNTGSQGVQGPKGESGSNIDMTKCHPTTLEQDNQAPTAGYEHPNSRLYCPNGEFLFSHSWEREQRGIDLNGWGFSEIEYHYGTSVDPTWPIGDPTKPLKGVSYGTSYPENTPDPKPHDPWGIGVCCPLPQ